MQDLLSEVEIGKRYVCLDGLIIPVDADDIEFEGWHAKHSLDFVPQVEALGDSSIIDSLLANEGYWESNAIPDDDKGLKI